MNAHTDLVHQLLVDPILQWLAATALALLFAGAAYGKLRDLSGFRFVLSSYELLPEPIVAVFAVTLPIVELLLTVALCMPATWSVSPWLALALLGLYACAISVNLLRGRTHLDCGCMGAGHKALSPWLVVRNLIVMLLPVLLLLPVLPRELVWFDGLTLLFGVAALALIYRLGDQLIGNRTLQQEWLSHG